MFSDILDFELSFSPKEDKQETNLMLYDMHAVIRYQDGTALNKVIEFPCKFNESIHMRDYDIMGDWIIVRLSFGDMYFDGHTLEKLGFVKRELGVWVESSPEQIIYVSPTQVTELNSRLEIIKQYPVPERMKKFVPKQDF